MQNHEFLSKDRFGTGDAVYVPLMQPPSFQWHLTADLSTPDPLHLKPAGIGWSGVNSTGCLIVNNLRVDLVEPAFGFLNMISEVLPTSDEADEIGDRLIQEAIGTPLIKPLVKRLSKK